MPAMQREESARSFEPAPEGQFVAVLCDIVDLGHKEVVYEGESKGVHPHIRLAWQIEDDEQQGEDGQPKRFLVNDRQMKLSFHEKAALTKRLTEWLGAKTLKQMLDDGADMDDLIGKPALITVEHSERNGTVYANVVSVAALPKKMPAINVEGYDRQQGRDSWAERQPEYSAYIKLTQAQKQGLMQGGPNPEPVAPVKRGQFVPNADEAPEPRRSPVVSQAQRDRMEAKPPADKHDFEAAQARAQDAIAKAKETPELEDEDDPFADGG